MLIKLTVALPWPSRKALIAMTGEEFGRVRVRVAAPRSRATCCKLFGAYCVCGLAGPTSMAGETGGCSRSNRRWLMA